MKEHSDRVHSKLLHHGYFLIIFAIAVRRGIEVGARNLLIQIDNALIISNLKWIWLILILMITRNFCLVLKHLTRFFFLQIDWKKIKCILLPSRESFFRVIVSPFLLLIYWKFGRKEKGNARNGNWMGK